MATAESIGRFAAVILRNFPSGVFHDVGAGLQELHQPRGDIGSHFHCVLQNAAQFRDDVPGQDQGHNNTGPLDADWDVLGDQHHDPVRYGRHDDHGDHAALVPQALPCGGAAPLMGFAGSHGSAEIVQRHAGHPCDQHDPFPAQESAQGRTGSHDGRLDRYQILVHFVVPPLILFPVLPGKKIITNAAPGSLSRSRICF